MIKTFEEIEKMRVAGRAAASVLDFVTPHVVPGVSTEKLNALCHDFIVSRGWVPAPLHYHGFPKSICTSVNNVVCHGIPSGQEVLCDGDVVNIDITVIVDGFHGDTSRMFLVGDVDEKSRLLVQRTHDAMMLGIDVVKPGVHFNDIGVAISAFVKQFGYGIVRDFAGHGIGRVFHEPPNVLHYDAGFSRALIREGMIFTVEPMINMTQEWRVVVDARDGWTARTVDGARSAQWEHTVLVTSTGTEILTQS